jgi:uncharacterized protein
VGESPDVAITLRDPVHGSIRLDDWAVPLVDHAVYQRLRRVQQLGTAHLVYPGAHHKRFEHGLGAYHLAGGLAHALELDEPAALTLRAAALLHDVGHGPFSHAFEEMQAGRHEETTVDLVRWGPLADLLRQGGIDPVAVAQAVMGKGPLSGLVSGALDADRMDYLVRDAHYTGVPSGADPDRLIAVVERDHEHGLVLRDSGVIAAESLLTTRFLMYPAVYLHHTVRASERILQRAIQAYVEDGHAQLKDLERETDDGLLHRLREAGAIAAEMVRRLDERRLYKRAHEGMPSEAGSPRVAPLVRDAAARRQAEAEIAAAAGVPEHHVLVDVPHAPRFHEFGLMVRTRRGQAVALAERSTLVHVLQEARMDHWRYWVFAPRRSVEAVEAAAAAYFAT